MKSAMCISVEPQVKVYGMEGNFEENIRFIANLGFDGIELRTDLEPDQIDSKRIKETVARYDLEISALAQGQYYYQYGLSLSTGNREVREKAVEKIKESIKVAGELNSKVIIGGVQGKYERSYEESFCYMKDCLQECSKTAAEQGVLLLLEPVNRYVPMLLRTVREGIRIIDEIGSPWIKLMADSYHMNIEEVSIYESIRQAKGYLAHFHVADSNRLAPGQGHIDFKGIVATLKEIGYKDYLSAEILPLPDQLTAARLTIQCLKPLL
ncbi:TIM barrel protein [Chloroflexota bacterium]